MIENYDSVDVFVGVDVGKGEHHAVALNRAGKVAVTALKSLAATVSDPAPIAHAE